jgi:hypothetical protein
MKLVKPLVAALICGILFVPAVAKAAKDAENNAAVKAGSPPTPGGSSQCHAIARLFDTTICREQLAPYEFDKQRFGSPNAKIDPRVVAQQNTLLRRAIWHAGLVRKFGDKAAPPTTDEIEAFRKGFNQSMDSSYEADRKTADYIKNFLDKYTYSPENEARLRQLLDVTQASLKLYSERQQHTHALPQEYQFVVDTAERAIARNMLTEWKNDKILYEHYHGHITLVAGNVLPIDAYKEFIKYIREEGKLAILDPQYATVMEDLDKLLSEKHEYLPGSSDIAKKYFMAPDWQFSLANSSSRFKDLQEQVAKIPNLGPKTGADVKEPDLIGKQSIPSPSAGSPNDSQKKN